MNNTFHGAITEIQNANGRLNVYGKFGRSGRKVLISKPPKIEEDGEVIVDMRELRGHHAFTIIKEIRQACMQFGYETLENESEN